MEQLINFSLIANLISIVINVFIYSYNVYRVSTTKVDGELKVTQRILIFDLLIIIVSAIFFGFVYRTVLFDKDHVTEALYFLNFALLLFNIASNIRGVWLSLIIERK